MHWITRTNTGPAEGKSFQMGAGSLIEWSLNNSNSLLRKFGHHHAASPGAPETAFSFCRARQAPFIIPPKHSAAALRQQPFRCARELYRSANGEGSGGGWGAQQGTVGCDGQQSAPISIGGLTAFSSATGRWPQSVRSQYLCTHTEMCFHD